jgi:general secretion pathway protein G
MPGYNKQQGFSLLELVIVIILISLLIVIAIDRLLVLRVEAERVSVEKLAGELRSAMGITVASTIATDGGLKNIYKLHKSNPMDMLAETPGTYIGEISAADLDKIDNGNWYFDTDEGALVYKVINRDNLVTELEGPKRIRFQLQLVYSDKNHNRRYDVGHDSVQGMRLKALDKYHWQLDKNVEDIAGELKP